MTAKKKKETPIANLNGIVYMIDHWDGSKPRDFIASIRRMAVDAISVLQIPDPFVQRVAFLVLALQQSSEVSVKIINGRRIVRIKVLDKTIYEWAHEEAHALAEKRT